MRVTKGCSRKLATSHLLLYIHHIPLSIAFTMASVVGDTPMVVKFSSY